MKRLIRLVSLFKAPSSYTKEDVVEISCHGSSYILQQIIQVCISSGARMAKEGEFTLRAYLNGQMDLSQAEAVADLIASESEAAHQMAMHQMRGGFSAEIKKLREEVIHFASMIELELDFGEEDVEFANREDLRTLIENVLRLIRSLTDSFQLGNAMKNGINTVIAGRPNAGKSTLLNALLNEDRAIVSDIAGTTRDTIEEVMNIKGVQFRIIDTAGIREASDQIEAIGVEKTFKEVKRSSILVYMYDVLETYPDKVLYDLRQLTEGEQIPLVIIANKTDKLTELSDAEQYTRNRTFDNGLLAMEYELDQTYKIIRISAKSLDDVEKVKERLFDLVHAGTVNASNTIVSNSRHYAALTQASESLQSVLEGLDNHITGDFLAMDIRHSLNALGEITGEISSDDLLGNIFSKFCIGK